MKCRSGLPFVTAAFSLTAAVSLASLPLVATGCNETTGSDDLVDPSDGSLQGELAIYIADDFERGSQTRYAIRSASGEERWLNFDAHPGLEAGARIKVWGSDLGELFQVSSIRQIAPPVEIEPIKSELRMGMSYPAKRLAFVVVNTGGTPNLTLEQAKQRVNGPNTNPTTNPALKYYYAEASYGTEYLEADAFAFDYPMTSCNTSGMSRTLKPMVDQMGGGAFNHYLWYIGTRTSACGWSGMATTGTPSAPSKDSYYNGSSSCVVLVQEPGHNFGMMHSSSMNCPNTPFADQPDGTCTHNEYGDPFDPMGGGCRHMNIWQKLYNGWPQGCNAVRVRASGTFTLVPIELACDGAQGLQIPAPKTRMFRRSGGGGSATNDALTHYYLELRTKRGIDTNMTTQVLVHVGGDIAGRNSRGLHTWLLDMRKAGSTQQGLTAGKSYTDPAGGVTFEVTELDEMHATVKVTMTADGGGPLCIDKTTPFQAPGPGIESCNSEVSQPGGMGGRPAGTGGAGGGAGGRPGGSGGAGGGSGATGGAGGRSGTGGSGTGTGTGGRGTGGASGTGGRGTGGATPPTGTGGQVGTGGAIVPPVGTGGSTPVGTGGTTSTGSGGSTGTPDGGGTGITPDSVGGCACAMDSGLGASAPQGSLTLMLVIGGFALARTRRRRR